MKNETYELNRELFNSTTGQSASIHVEEIDQKNLSKMGIELVNILDGLNLNENLIDDGVSIFKETSDIFNEKMNGVLVSDYRISDSFILNFSNCDIRGVDFGNSDLSKCIFTNAIFDENTRLWDVTVSPKQLGAIGAP